MDLRPSKDEYFLIKAWTASLRSTCVRRAVGCTLVNGLGHDIGSGYNGRPAGLEHCNDVVENWTDLWTKQKKYPHACQDAFAPSGSKPAGCEAVHAEMNALLQCYDILWLDTCYVTRSPCVPCVKQLMNTSCRRIVFATVSSDIEKASELWLRSNQVKQSQPHMQGKVREWIHLPIPNPFQDMKFQTANIQGK